MKITTALQLVIELASQNSLSKLEAIESPDLAKEMRRQERAIKQTTRLLELLRSFRAVMKGTNSNE